MKNLDLFLSLPIKSNNTLKVECKVYALNKVKYESCRLLIDTGASTTALSRKLLRKLLYADFKKGTVEKHCASGVILLDTVEISRITIGGEFLCNDIKVDVLDWENKSFHGVLGIMFYII